MLSELLNVHMEDLLVKKTTETIIFEIELLHKRKSVVRYMEYYKQLHKMLAKLT